jgi:hypothetical protein
MSIYDYNYGNSDEETGNEVIKNNINALVTKIYGLESCVVSLEQKLKASAIDKEMFFKYLEFKGLGTKEEFEKYKKDYEALKDIN